MAVASGCQISSFEHPIGSFRKLSDEHGFEVGRAFYNTIDKEQNRL